jgi:hypothetical protein
MLIMLVIWGNGMHSWNLFSTYQIIVGIIILKTDLWQNITMYIRLLIQAIKVWAF